MAETMVIKYIFSLDPVQTLFIKEKQHLLDHFTLTKHVSFDIIIFALVFTSPAAGS